jgi:hypothetical protein
MTRVEQKTLPQTTQWCAGTGERQESFLRQLEQGNAPEDEWQGPEEDAKWTRKLLLVQPGPRLAWETGWKTVEQLQSVSR